MTDTFRPEFLESIQKHQLTIIENSENVKIFRFADPNTISLSCTIIYASNTCTITGDMGSYVFGRLLDVYGFFARNQSVFCFGYVKEKVLAQDVNGKLEYFDGDLAGEMIVENNVHYWLVAQSRANKDEYILEDYEGNTTSCRLDELHNKFTMWKEPEPVKPSADSLPKPIREFGYLETVWYVNKTKDRYAPYGITKNGDWLSTQYTSLSRGCYYATEKDCQAVCDWLMNR